MRFTLILAVALALMAAPDEIARWRADYEASLKAPRGWLSVAGLFWLHAGDNVVGSDPQSDVVLPAGAAKRAGVLKLDGGKVTFENRPLKSDASGKPDEVKIGDLTMTIIERGGKTGVRLRDPDAETRRDFTGCKWFAADPAWRVHAKWVAYAKPKKIAITISSG